jgi:poly(3-hydroxybutyrate) depolymerase
MYQANSFLSYLVRRSRNDRSLLGFLSIVVAACGTCFPQILVAASERLEALGKASLNLEYAYTGGQYTSEPIRYRLFLPKPFDARRKYPLILWLHGYGDHGDDNLSQLLHIDTTVYRDGLEGSYPFFILAPQCSEKHDRNWLEPLSNNSDDMLAIAMKILAQVEQNYPIDDRRITAIGISSGGTACWTLVALYGDRFAAITPQGAGGAERSLIPRMLSTPIWAFHATKDPKTPVDGVRSTISSVVAAGGIAHLTETEDVEHNCWTTAFAQHDLLYWLLHQTLGQRSLRPGRYRPMIYGAFLLGQIWPLLCAAGIIILVGVACYRHYRTSLPAPECIDQDDAVLEIFQPDRWR